MCAGAGTSVSSRFSVNSSNHSRRSRNRSSEARLLSLFFLFWVSSGSCQFPGAGSSLRSVAGLQDVLDESCGGDVEDELVPEFDDNPGTTRGTKFFRLASNILPLFGQVWLLTAGPLIVFSVFFAELSKWWNCKRVIEKLHSHEEAKIVNVYLCFLTCLHFSTGR